MQTKALDCLCVSNERKPLLGLVQAMSFADKNPVPTDLEPRSGFAATQLGKLVCELKTEKCEHQTSTAVCGTYYILK